MCWPVHREEQASFLWTKRETLYGAARGLGLDSVGFLIHNASDVIAAAESDQSHAAKALVEKVVPALKVVVESACEIQESLHHAQTQYAILAFAPLQVLPLGAMIAIPSVVVWLIDTECFEMDLVYFEFENTYVVLSRLFVSSQTGSWRGCSWVWKAHDAAS